MPFDRFSFAMLLSSTMRRILELSPLVMNRHMTPNLYHLDAIWVYLLLEI